MQNTRRPLYTFRFLALCLFMLLAYCNTSVFYSLYPYLESLGVPQGHARAGDGGGLGPGAGPGHGRGAAVAQRAHVCALRPAGEGREFEPHGHGPADGQFLGPILGGVAVGLFGQAGFLGVGFLANLGGVWLALDFLRRGWTGAQQGEG